MCGVFGYVGQEADVGHSILVALKTLEYRGYDSWGIAVAGEGDLILDKDVGRINGHLSTYPRSVLGIGHTRWATHGGVTSANAHPHTDCSRRIAIVHNGIIENHALLRADLERGGHHFSSETDSEVVAHLVEARLADGEDFAAAVSHVFALLQGYNAIVVMDRPGRQFAAIKNVSPLVVGQGPAGVTVASDAVALQDHADRLLYLEDDQLAVMTARGVDVYDRASMRPITPFTTGIEQISRDTALGEHPDFMSKEMSEQPRTLRRLVHEGREEIEALADAICSSTRVVLVGCGTAGNAALAGSYFLDRLCGRDAVDIPASEFRYRSRSLDADTLVIAMSQSGETVDVLEAVAAARARGARLAAIVNTPNSTLDRTVETRVRLRAGVEQCVLATKSYTAKLATLLMTAFALNDRWDDGAAAVRHAADAVDSLLQPQARAHMQEIAGRLSAAHHLFVIGRGVHYPSALEAALKIKEVSYIHAEGFAGGELKHGVIALVAPGTPCLVFAPDDETRTDVLSGAAELRSRGGHIIGIGSTPDPVFADFVAIPDTGVSTPIVEAVPGQLFGYFAALARGNDPDRPRNLAKSVTVK
jgi:glucosamine--fructose-6-phosphate aminotransferase (isomerizing)